MHGQLGFSPQEVQIVTQSEEAETDGATILLCLCHTATLTARLASVTEAQKNHLFQQSERCSAPLSLVFPSRPKDAMRALKKRLTGNKNYREVMLALTVRRHVGTFCYRNVFHLNALELYNKAFHKGGFMSFLFVLSESVPLQVLETCVKNCGHRFHVQVANRDFIDGVLVKIISPKTNPPTIVQDKVLSLIQVSCGSRRILLYKPDPQLSKVCMIEKRMCTQSHAQIGFYQFKSHNRSEFVFISFISARKIQPWKKIML